MLGTGGIWKLSVLSAQSCYEPKTILQNKVYLKGEKLVNFENITPLKTSFFHCCCRKVSCQLTGFLPQVISIFFLHPFKISLSLMFCTLTTRYPVVNFCLFSLLGIYVSQICRLVFCTNLGKFSSASLNIVSLSLSLIFLSGIPIRLYDKSFLFCSLCPLT